MKKLFEIRGRSLRLVDKERMILKIDGRYFDMTGREVAYKEAPIHIPTEREDDDAWEREQIARQGLPQPLHSKSTVEPEWEIDDGFGCFGFQNEAGEFVIEPQYAYAHEFTCGLASVNLNRTWYKGENGDRYYENHCGYIDANGKTVIGFQFDEASPFNRYGVAVVSTLEESFPIDLKGNRLTDLGVPCLFGEYYDYEDRFFGFRYQDGTSEGPIGIYDTKERRVLLEPSVDGFTVCDENCLCLEGVKEENGVKEIYPYYIDASGAVLYPWLYEKDFVVVERPDSNGVSAVAKAKYVEIKTTQGSAYPYPVKRYDRTLFYGLYSKKEAYLLPLEYEWIAQIADGIWSCRKDGMITVVKTDENDGSME